MLIYTIENICFASWPLQSAWEWKLFLCLLGKLFETNTICCCFVTSLKLHQSSRSESCSFATPLKAIWDKRSSLLHCHLIEIIMLVIKIWKLFFCLLHPWKLFEANIILLLLCHLLEIVTTVIKIWKLFLCLPHHWKLFETNMLCCYFVNHQDLKAVPLLATQLKVVWDKCGLLLLCHLNENEIVMPVIKICICVPACFNHCIAKSFCAFSCVFVFCSPPQVNVTHLSLPAWCHQRFCKVYL